MAMRTLTVKLPERTYSIYIEQGLLNNISQEIKKIYKNRKIAIITDSNINHLDLSINNTQFHSNMNSIKA